MNCFCVGLLRNKIFKDDTLRSRELCFTVSLFSNIFMDQRTNQEKKSLIIVNQFY